MNSTPKRRRGPRSPHALPIPSMRKIREIIDTFDGELVLISVAFASGHGRRYDVVRIVQRTGVATCIGRELDLTTARQVAARPAAKDGLPLSTAERKT